MRKRLLLAMSAGLALAFAASAEASITFCPDGDGGGAGTSCIQIDLMDPTVGNALSMDLNATSVAGDIGTLLFQANLGITSLDGSQNYSNGSNGTFFTFAAEFDEEILVSVAGTLLFTTPSTETGDTFGTFNMYAQIGEGDNLQGFCFVDCGPGSILILSGEFVNDPAEFFGNFSANLFADPELLDQFNADNWSDQLTLSGGGFFQAQIVITFVDADFFPTLSVDDSFIFATTEQNLPFVQGDPSYCFSSDAVTSCNVNAVGTLGTVNGFDGSNTILQTDANLSFLTTAAVPEPATLTLFGLGLAGVAARRMRRRPKAS